MSYEHVHHVLTTSPTKGAARMVLVVLAEAADKNGVCWLAVSTVAARANVSEIHARNILHQLEAEGHICSETRPGTTNRYKIPTTKEADTPLTQLDPPPLTQLEGNHQLKVNEPSLLPDGGVHAVYMDNFGLLTPMLAEELSDLETEYGKQWLVDAMRLAVTKGVRNLRYVGGILRRWKSEGRKDQPEVAKPAPVVSTLKEYKP